MIRDVVSSEDGLRTRTKALEKLAVGKKTIELVGIALAYEMPAIENISAFTNYTDENCDRELFSASAWRCFDLYSVMDVPPKMLMLRFSLYCIFVLWHIAVKDGMI